MKKLKLDLDSLRVDTFHTSRTVAKAEGTVRAHQITAPTACGCVSTVFTMACYDYDGDTIWDYFAPGTTPQSEFACTNVN